MTYAKYFINIIVNKYRNKYYEYNTKMVMFIVVSLY